MTEMETIIRSLSTEELMVYRQNLHKECLLIQSISDSLVYLKEKSDKKLFTYKFNKYNNRVQCVITKINDPHQSNSINCVIGESKFNKKDPQTSKRMASERALTNLQKINPEIVLDWDLSKKDCAKEQLLKYVDRIYNYRVPLHPVSVLTELSVKFKFGVSFFYSFNQVHNLILDNPEPQFVRRHCICECTIIFFDHQSTNNLTVIGIGENKKDSKKDAVLKIIELGLIDDIIF